MKKKNLIQRLVYAFKFSSLMISKILKNKKQKKIVVIKILWAQRARIMARFRDDSKRVRYDSLIKANGNNIKLLRVPSLFLS